jgi:calreticulin
VIQFSVKHEQNIDCGGGYLKVFDCGLNQKDMHGDSPYQIMFGPDICGPGTKKVSLNTTICPFTFLRYNRVQFYEI